MDSWQSSMKRHYQTRKNCTAIRQWQTLQMLTIKYARRVMKDFRIQNLREYHDLYVQSDTLLLADVLESFFILFGSI